MLAEVQAELDGTKMERDRYQEGEATSKQLAEELRIQGVALRVSDLFFVDVENS